MCSVHQYSFGSETKARHHVSELTEEKKAQPLSDLTHLPTTTGALLRKKG